MSVSAEISIGWSKPTGLTVVRERSGLTGSKATFSWDKIGTEWRVLINGTSHIVKNNPTFTVGLPMGGETCVKVQTVYETGLATSDWSSEVCIKNDRDKYCESKCNTVKTKNHGSARTRYARAINSGAAAAFR